MRLWMTSYARPVRRSSAGLLSVAAHTVDSAVVRSQNSAAPAYPVDLLEKHVEGRVLAQYVVDTTGFADPTSLAVLSSTHDLFTRAAREALPYMRFTPAKIGRSKVRQLVEQSFTFRITPPTPPGG